MFEKIEIYYRSKNPFVQNLSELYMGDAVSAIKNLVKTETKEEKGAESSFHNFDELFHPHNFDCDIIPKTPGGPTTGMDREIHYMILSTCIKIMETLLFYG